MFRSPGSHISEHELLYLLTDHRFEHFSPKQLLKLHCDKITVILWTLCCFPALLPLLCNALWEIQLLEVHTCNLQMHTSRDFTCTCLDVNPL